jgi:nitrous oxidase accessory protein
MGKSRRPERKRLLAPEYLWMQGLWSMTMRVRSIALAFALSMSTFCLVISVLPPHAESSTLFVGGVSPGNHSNIQEAIDLATPGDTIYVFGGTYVEHLVISKPLTVRGELTDTPVLDGNGTGDAIRIYSSWVNVSGFSITNSGTIRGDAGIRLDHVSNSYIANNSLFSHEWNGIALVGSYNNTIADNIVQSNRGIGIYLNSSRDNTVTRNNVSYNSDGIDLSYSDDNMIVDNIAAHNRYGFVLLESDRNMVTDNNISFNEIFGISVISSDSNTIIRNSISDNENGIELTMSDYNWIYHNSFSNNAHQALDDSETNQWDNGYPSGGNYWSDHVGNDKRSGPNQDQRGSDGIGDAPYAIFENPVGDKTDEDRYPLMRAFGFPAKEVQQDLPWVEMGALVLVSAVVFFALFFFAKRRKPQEDSSPSTDEG